MGAFTKRTLTNVTTISERERVLEDCLTVVASVIAQNGKAFWPIYMLLEEELSELRNRQQKLTASLNRISSSRNKLKLESVL